MKHRPDIPLIKMKPGLCFLEQPQYVPMRDLNPLWLPGGTGRINDIRQVIWLVQRFQVPRFVRRTQSFKTHSYRLGSRQLESNFPWVSSTFGCASSSMKASRSSGYDGSSGR